VSPIGKGADIVEDRQIEKSKRSQRNPSRSSEGRTRKKKEIAAVNTRPSPLAEREREVAGGRPLDRATGIKSWEEKVEKETPECTERGRKKAEKEGDPKARRAQLKK